VSRFVGGNRVELHKECAERFDRAQRPNPVNAPVSLARDDCEMPEYYRGIRPDDGFDPDPMTPLDFHDERERT
jgi:hypothetical protein